MAFLDDFYGTAHFVVTVVALCCCSAGPGAGTRCGATPWRSPPALALIGFAFFPLMPPRLLPSSYHFVDTLETIGGLWSFESGPMAQVSNQYAAMPSLHFAWSSWCALVHGARSSSRRWAKVADLLLSRPDSVLHRGHR